MKRACPRPSERAEGPREWARARDVGAPPAARLPHVFSLSLCRPRFRCVTSGFDCSRSWVWVFFFPAFGRELSTAKVAGKLAYFLWRGVLAASGFVEEIVEFWLMWLGNQLTHCYSRLVLEIWLRKQESCTFRFWSLFLDTFRPRSDMAALKSRKFTFFGRPHLVLFDNFQKYQRETFFVLLETILSGILNA